MSYPFPEIGEITMQMIGKALEGSQKLTFCIFEKVVKYLHICCGILMIWKRDFRNFMIFIQNVTFYALKGSVSWNLRKSAEFDPQNHQYSLGNIDVLSFSDFHENIAELVVFTVPKLMFLVKSAKMSRGDPFG